MPEDISLLPQEVEKVRAQEAREQLVRRGALVFLIFSLLLTSSSLAYSYILRRNLSSLETEVAKEKSKVSSLSDVAAKAYDLDRRSQTLQAVFAETAYFSKLLSEIAGAVPPDVKVAEMTAPSEKSVAISGSSRSYVSLAKFLLALKDGDSIFNVVELRSVSLDKQTGEVSFDINLGMVEGGLRQ
jgi:Tfp pilus assembly protein PilN